MDEYNKLIDRCIYEITESVYKADIDFKKIDARYNTMKAITESTLDSSDIILEQEEEKKNNEKKGIIRTLIDGIISKIQKLLDAFRDKDESYRVKDDQQFDAGISEDDFKASTNKLDILGQKMDALVNAAKGSDKEAYKKAEAEYDAIVKELSEVNKKMLTNVKQDASQANEDHAKKHTFIKGTAVMSGLHIIRKTLKRAKENTQELKNNGIDDSFGDIFKKMFDNEDDVKNAAKELVVKLGLVTTASGTFEEVINHIINKSNNEESDKSSENNSSNNDKTDNDEDDEDHDSSDDKDKETDNEESDKSDDESDNNNAKQELDNSLSTWIIKRCHGNLDEALKIKDVRPKFKETGKFSPYLFDTNKDGFFNKIKSNDKLLRERVKGMKDKSKPPIFFDLWGFFYKNSKISLDKYIEGQKNLKDRVDKIREEEHMDKIHWDKITANVAMKLITEREPKKGERYSWRSYTEDQ